MSTPKRRQVVSTEFRCAFLGGLDLSADSLQPKKVSEKTQTGRERRVSADKSPFSQYSQPLSITSSVSNIV